MKTNERLIYELKKYFMTQKIEVVCHLLANYMIDIHRFSNIEILEKDKLLSLLYRSQKNSKTLTDFIINGPSGNLVLSTENHKDSVRD